MNIDPDAIRIFAKRSKIACVSNVSIAFTMDEKGK